MKTLKDLKESFLAAAGNYVAIANKQKAAKAAKRKKALEKAAKEDGGSFATARDKNGNDIKVYIPGNNKR